MYDNKKKVLSLLELQELESKPWKIENRENRETKQMTRQPQQVHPFPTTTTANNPSNRVEPINVTNGILAFYASRTL